MKAILVETAGVGRLLDVSNDIFELQEIVGGYIEVHRVTDTACLLCDEEATLKRLRATLLVPILHGISHVFCGPLLFTGYGYNDNGVGDFVSLSEEDIDYLCQQLHLKLQLVEES